MPFWLVGWFFFSAPLELRCLSGADPQVIFLSKTRETQKGAEKQRQ